MQRLLIALAWAPLSLGAADFDRDIRPILSNTCFTCHGPDAGNRKTVLRFDTEQGSQVELLSGGRAIVPGDPEQSKILERLTTDDPIRRMPPAYEGHDKLPPEQIEAIRRWIAEGAEWSGHWSFQEPKRPQPPLIDHNSGRSASPIDALVLRTAKAAGLEPAPRADQRTLIRRASLDLTGLPPTPDQVQAYLADRSPDALEHAVDRLLASPHYGERMAIPWLDAARYADTNGYQSDGVRSMWRWRDWVIDAFNRNMGFDQFTIEQIAGDLLPNADRDQIIATAFHRNHRTNAEGGIVEEEFRVEYVADRAETTGTVWLGLTVGCARCHDHKFDPISQKDFYSLFAYFNNVEDERGLVYNFGNDGAVIEAPTAEQEARLGELGEQVDEAEAEWERASEGLDEKLNRWSPAEGLDGFTREGLAAHFPLDEVFVENALIGVHDLKRNLASRSTTLEHGKGVFGPAAVLDGERFVDGGGVAGFDYDQPFTVSFWMRPESLNGGLISRMEDHKAGSGWGLFLREGRLRFEFTMRHTDLSMRVETGDAIKPKRWHHVVVSSLGSRPTHQGVTLRVDGAVMPFDVEWDDLKWPIVYSGYPLRIGAAGGERFVGSIDEVRLYSRVLNEAESVTLGVRKSLAEIARQAPGKRRPAETNKLRAVYLEQAADRPVRRARQAMADARRRRAKFQASIPTVMVMREGPPKQAYLLRRGAYDAHGDAVDPAPPAALPSPDPSWPRNRLGLARWLVSRSNPLTARVTVNRYWQMFFGTGLVATPGDFGAQGERPSHPELLDWLAVEFMESGWNVKHILKTIVMSDAYQRSSQVSAEALEADPENRLLARGPRFRLPAEAVRDQALFASGLLNQRVGGPSVKPYQPVGLWKEVSGATYVPDSGDKLYRRSLYSYWKRTVAPPGMVGFDAPNREGCIVRRARTNTPLQALSLMNDVTYLEAARMMAERMMREGGSSVGDRIDKGFELTLSRLATELETRTLSQALERFEAIFEADPDEAYEFLMQGEAPRDESLDESELAAWAGIASLILNLDEAVTKE